VTPSSPAPLNGGPVRLPLAVKILVMGGTRFIGKPLVATIDYALRPTSSPCSPRGRNPFPAGVSISGGRIAATSEGPGAAAGKLPQIDHRRSGRSC